MQWRVQWTYGGRIGGSFCECLIEWSWCGNRWFGYYEVAYLIMKIFIEINEFLLSLIEVQVMNTMKL